MRAAIAVLVTSVLLLVPGAAEARVIFKAPKQAKAVSLITFKGVAGKKRGARVAVQRRVGKRWKAVASGRTAKKGRFALTWVSPSKRGRVSVRAVAGRSRSGVRRVRVLPRPKGAPRIVVSPKTRVISPSVVKDIPAGGEPGALTYAGGNDIKKGAIVVIGKGPDTPAGFLGKVTGVERRNGTTVADTVPATLLDAVPEGSVELVGKPVPAQTTRAAKKIVCEGSGGVSINPDLSFTSGLDFSGSWTLLGGLNASLTANASLDASLEAIAQASGSCSLPKRSVLHLKGPTVTGAVGPVPVVLTSDLDVYLDASASVQGAVTTSASAGFDASAGISYSSGSGFSGSNSFTPRFTFSPPELSASANAGVNVTPTVDVLLYGVVGPRFALRTGVQFDADPAANPWWTLKIPVDLTASLAIPALDLESPLLHVYQTDFPLADAGGPFGTPPPPGTTVNNVTVAANSVAAGDAHSCVLKPSNTVACWGRNVEGQIGDATNAQRLVPVAVSGVDDAVGISAGHNHTCALRLHGQVKCWGDGRNAPTSVTGVTTATQLAAFGNRSCARLSNGHVTCWGTDLKPTEVAGITDATTVALGTSHTCAIRAAGTVLCWGSGVEGELGDGNSYPNSSTSPVTTPVTVKGLTDATGLGLGFNHSCALRATGAVVCWGGNAYGQLGNGNKPNDSNVPVAVNGITDAVLVRAGGAHTCALLAAGAMRCWGWNQRGQLGDGSGAVVQSSPTSVSGITDATGIAGGSEHTCALLTGGGASCWGWNDQGQLGNGSTDDKPTPTPVGAF